MKEKRQTREKTEKKGPQSWRAVYFYSFSLFLFEYLLLDLFAFGNSVVDYSMQVTLGLFLTIQYISFISVIFTVDKFSRIKEIVTSSKINIAAAIVASICIVYLLFMYLNTKLFSMSIVTVLIVFLVTLVLAIFFDKRK